MSTISSYYLPVINSLGALSIRSFCTFIFNHEILQLHHFISSDSCSCLYSKHVMFVSHGQA